MDLFTNAFVKEKSLLGECGEEKEAKEPSQGQVWASGRRCGESQE